MTTFKTFWVDGKPTPQGSKKAFIINGKAVLVESSTGNKTWRKTVTNAIKASDDYQQFKGAVNISLTFWMPKAKTNKTETMTQKPDIDKLIRSVSDAAVDSGLIEDDSKITYITASKRWAEDNMPGVMIMVWQDDTP